MLNFSENSIRHYLRAGESISGETLTFDPIHRKFKRLLWAMLALFVLFLFLPWTQNIRADGRVSTLRPEHRPQTITAVIAGRIEKWHVREGQAVQKGDTIVSLSEIKTDYFDPALVARTGEQVSAKTEAIGTYSNKAAALEDQITAMRAELNSKTNQIRNKIIQAEFKIANDQNDLERAKVDRQIAQRQFEGAKNLYDKGLKSLTDLEEKRSKLQEYDVKVRNAENKLDISRNEFDNLKVELTLVQSETAGKIAKAESDKFSALADGYEAEATVSKLKVSQENYTRRAAFYAVTAPQDGYIVQAIRPGIGEIVKEGEPIVGILPHDYQLAVEMYVKPIDLPLLEPGQVVRFMFDGWPAFVFSGWPGQSVGTYQGRIAALDRTISSNGKFRVLVSPDPEAPAWPVQLQPGGGAQGIALLNDVPLWYELWRQINGFPPDFYKSALPASPGTGAGEKK